MVVVDELRQIAIPINDTGYLLLSEIESRLDFPPDEASFISDLLSLHTLMPQQALREARSLQEKYSLNVPPGPYRPAPY